MIEQIILGIIQGVAEWLPVSSEGLIVLAKTRIFGATGGLGLMVREALFLHLGTVLAAMLYFRADVAALFKALIRCRAAPDADRSLLRFLLISTVISGGLGLALLSGLASLESRVESSAKFLTLAIGVSLIITAVLQLKSRGGGARTGADLTIKDSLLLGVAQGLAALPGLSRSGLTVAALLLLKFDKAQALRISFLMSIPLVLAGNVVKSAFELKEFAVSWPSLAGLLCAFVFGLATIHILIEAARKINFGYFLLGFGLLTIASAFL